MTDASLRRERLLRRPPNLDFLLTRRTAFLRRFLTPGQRVLEVGAGLGIVGTYVPGLSLVSTDIEPQDWLDGTADLMDLPFEDASFDAVVCLHALHHVDHPRRAMEEMLRVTRPGGRILLSEPHASLVLRAVLWLTGHEYADFSADPFSDDDCQTRRPAGNNAIPDLLFGDLGRFLQVFPQLTVEFDRFNECLVFLNSGGVGFAAPHLSLPRTALAMLGAVDEWLMRFPSLFPLCREIVFLKTGAQPRQ